MPHTLLRIALATILAAGCAKSSAPAAKAPPASTTGSADGNLAAQIPHDSISDKADAGRILGDPKATIWVVMASDFQCPFCKTWHDALFQPLLKNYVNTGKVRLAFLNMPLSMHPNAVPAAEAAMCAAVQNKFWPMHDALFATQAEWEVLPDPTPRLEALAGMNGVNLGPWRQCMSGHLTRPLIQADHDRASASGVNSTPTFFVDGQRVTGSDKDLGPMIDAALAKAGKKTP